MNLLPYPCSNENHPLQSCQNPLNPLQKVFKDKLLEIPIELSLFVSESIYTSLLLPDGG